MIDDVLPEAYQTSSPIKSNKTGSGVQLAQEVIYHFILHIVKQLHPETVLQEFKLLFIDYADKFNAELLLALGEIIADNDEETFRNTLKRSCYILIEHWETSRHYGYTKKLVQLFFSVQIDQEMLPPLSTRLRLWLVNFVSSQDYQQLQIFAAKYEGDRKSHWSHRYASYLLVPQYADVNNLAEQREAARVLSQQLKNQFKFDLAIYTARSQSSMAKDKMPKNPTLLGDDVLRLIKTIVAKRGDLSYANLANIFLKQTEKLAFHKFKLSLERYLFFSIPHKEFGKILNAQFNQKLNNLYSQYNEKTRDDELLLVTCNRVIDYLTTENYQKPSEIFLLFVQQGNPLTLIIVLLKIILICKNTRLHLEYCIAKLIQYYRNYPAEDCQWVINFCEIFTITFAIYAENVQYNLIKIEEDEPGARSGGSLDAYRVFAQLKWDTSSEVTP